MQHDSIQSHMTCMVMGLICKTTGDDDVRGVVVHVVDLCKHGGVISKISCDYQPETEPFKNL